MSEFGYRNNIAAYQTPKNDRRGKERESHHPSNCYSDNPRYAYVPFADCPAVATAPRDRLFDGSGEADMRPAFRCSCGAEIDCARDTCERCGSDKPGRWVDGSVA